MILRKRLLHTISKTRHKFPTTLTPQLVLLNLKNCPSDVTALNYFLKCVSHPNYFHNRQSFEYMVPIVSRLTDTYVSVKGVVKELESNGCLIKSQTFLMLLRIYSRGEMYDMVLKTLEEMCSYGYVPNTYVRNVVLDVIFKIGKVDIAFRFFRDTEGKNFLTYNTALCHLCKLRNVSGVCDVFRGMLREGFRPDFGTFYVVLDCLCKAGRLEESLQVLGVMISLGFSLMVNVWSMLIDGFCKVGKLGVASHLLEKMVESGNSPNVVTYTSLFKGFMRCEMFNSAISIVNTMESKGFSDDIFFCNVCIDCLSKLGRYTDAVDFFFSLLERNIQPDSYTFSSVLSILHVSQRIELLPRLIKEVSKYAASDVVVYNCLLSCVSKSRFSSHVVDIFNDMLYRGITPDWYSYIGLLRGLCRGGKLDKAIRVFVTNDLFHDVHVLTLMIAELIRLGRLDTAIRIFTKAVEEKFPLDVVSYTVVICGLVKVGSLREAFRLYCHMKERSILPNTYTYNAMLLGLCKSREEKLIELLVTEMVDAGIEWNCFTYNIIIRFLLKTRRFRAASILYEEMPSVYKASNALLVEHFAQAGELSDDCNSILEVYSVDLQFKTNKCSNDLPDVAASLA